MELPHETSSQHVSEVPPPPVPTLFFERSSAEINTPPSRNHKLITPVALELAEAVLPRPDATVNPPQNPLPAKGNHIHIVPEGRREPVARQPRGLPASSSSNP